VDGLHKRYGRTVAVHDASFTAAPGAITAVLGPNGAGKTSTVECCEGLRRPDGGAVRVLGRDPIRDGRWLRARVGVMLQGGGLPAGARAGEVLRLAAAMHARPRPPAELLTGLDLAEHERTTVRRLSGGQRQRLALAVAVVGRPDVVFLDEPTAGVDPQGRLVVWDLIRRLRDAGVAVLLTTHLLDEAERLADRVVLMAGGRVVATGPPSELTGGGYTLTFDAVPGLDLTGLADRLSAGVGAREVRPGRYLVAARDGTGDGTGTATHDTTYDATTDSTADGTGGAGGREPVRPGLDVHDLAAVTAWCARIGVMPDGLALGRRSLEDVFLQLTDPDSVADPDTGDVR
jgi:ABC-2 type transport system ATP-binding protein